MIGQEGWCMDPKAGRVRGVFSGEGSGEQMEGKVDRQAGLRS